MNTGCTLVICGACALVLCACQSPPARVPASGTRDEAMLGPITTLAGEWEMTDDDGATETGSVFAVTAAGSAVREIMFPGDPHEMTNLYHMDGQNLVLTHYCAAGNQPRMVATEARRTSEGTVYDFNFDSVSNLREEHTHYMGQMTLTILNDGSIRQNWHSYDREGNLTDPFTFVMHRTGTR